MTRVVEVRVDRRRDGGPIPSPDPVLGWVTEADEPGWIQAAADLRLERSGGTETRSVDGAAAAGVAWPFTPLAPGERATLSVRVRGTRDAWSDWSRPVPIERGALADGAWIAAFVGHPDPAAPAMPFTARVTVPLDARPRRAILVAAARGAYRATINGTDVDDAVLKPGWTPYAERLEHEWTDVTALVRTGANELLLDVAGGWFTEEYGFAGHGARVYGEQPEVAAQLVVEFDDGRTAVFATDARTQVATNSTVSSTLYHGESADLRRMRGPWLPAAIGSPGPVPEPATAEPVRRTQRLAVREVITTPSGRTVLDFGQNLVGRLRLRVRGSAGDTITLRHAEVLEHGELGVRPLRAARATDRLVLADDEVTVWEPEFTFHGFRYAEVEGWPGRLDPADIEAVVLGSDLRRTGWFECSSPALQRLHENVVWSMRGNFLSIPTDCPQRDERLGWTGDIQVFAPTASFLYDTDAFLVSWLRSLSIEQRRHGGIVPFVVPDVFPSGAIPAAAWGDAATVVPTVLVERFADLGVLAQQYPSMRAWCDTIAARAGDRLIWDGGFQFGDWLDPDAPPDAPDEAKTPPEIVATAYLYRSTALTAAAASLLGHADDAAELADRAERIRNAFRAEYLTGAGRIVSDSPTAYALAIGFGLVEGAARERAGERLADLVRGAAYHLGTGFVGTPIVLDALCDTGHAAAAGRLLTQTGNPSWLYAVTMGATTTWERWDSMLEDGSINPGEMTSFNHYAFGAVADWMHRRLAGLAPAEPGYRRLRIAPIVLRGLEHASAALDTPYGRAEAGWRRLGDGRVEVRAVVAPNTTADILLPDGTGHEVGSGTHAWTVALDEAPMPLVGLDDPIGSLADDEEALDAVRRVLVGHGSAWTDLRRQLRRAPGDTVRASLDMLILTPGLAEPVEAALAEVGARRVSP